MIGLEFICKVFDIQYKEIAEKIGVSNQTITDWIKGKTAKIPEKRLNDLVTKIPELSNINKELFSKQLTPSDKQKITTSYLLIDIKRQLEELLEKPTLDELDDKQESLEIVTKGIVIQANLDSLLLIADHLIDNEDFMRELDDLIIKFDPSLKQYLK